MNINEKELIELASKIQYFRNNPLYFIEEFCGVKLNKWQRDIVNNINKVDIRNVNKIDIIYNARHCYERYQMYIRLCNEYVNMKDDEHIIIASPNKVKKLNRDELLKYLEGYWR